MTVKNSSNFLNVQMRVCKHGKNFLYCFLKIFLENNSAIEGKCGLVWVIQGQLLTCLGAQMREDTKF